MQKGNGMSRNDNGPATGKVAGPPVTRFAAQPA